MKKATKWDASEYLATEKDMAAYLDAALEDDDTSVIAAALGDIARAKGMTPTREIYQICQLSGYFSNNYSFLPR